MPDWLEAVLGGVLGLALIGGVFWLALRNPPDRRSDGGLTQHDASNYYRADDSHSL